MRPIVDGATMRLIEERSFAAGQTVEGLMDMVGLRLSAIIEQMLSKGTKRPTVLLLAGKGNNGADGYTALIHLIEKGHSALAWQIAPPSPQSVLERRMQAFLDRGGKVISYPDIPKLQEPLLIIDGIYGAGFKGTPDQASTKAILWANAQRGLIISIDVPSGVDPTTGEAPGEAVIADYTLACHFPKRGCFLRNGWEHTGSVLLADLPLESPKTDLCLLEKEDVIHLLPRRRRMQNKFEAGAITALAGSPGMMGAASLACEAAYTVGAGYVRLLLSQSLSNELCGLPREVVKKLLAEDSHEWEGWLQKAETLLIGPGLGRSEAVGKRLAALWPHLTAPGVMDADGLYWLAQKPQSEWHVAGKILTPHIGEASRLLNRTITEVDDSLLLELRTVASTTNSTIVLKGAPSFIFSNGEPILVMPRGDPGMATAGTGDVLTGMIAGFMAQRLTAHSAATLGTWLHGLAGEEAASKRTSYAVTASSLITVLPAAMLQVLEEGANGALRYYVPMGRAEPTVM